MCQQLVSHPQGELTPFAIGANLAPVSEVFHPCGRETDTHLNIVSEM
jgi:hypothetical protein